MPYSYRNAMLELGGMFKAGLITFDVMIESGQLLLWMNDEAHRGRALLR